ncbi:MAG: hypothetical protein ACTHN3_06395 [Solirubrobacterales bacterium]
MSRKWPNSPQTRHAGAYAELEPLSQRALQAAGFLSLLLILVVVNSLLNSGGASPFNPNPVAAAAERTAQVPGMRIDMTLTMGTESGLVTVTGKGAYNGETNLAEVSYDANSSGKRMEFDAILGESAWYFRYPQLAGRMPEGKEWMKLEGFPGQKEMSTPGVVSPEESLQMLRGSGAVRRLGRVRIGHVQTTRYRVTLTAGEIAKGLRAQGKDELAEELERVAPEMVGPVRSEVFVDRHGVVRRMRMASTSLSDGRPVTTKMQMDLFDFGIKPDVQVPDDSRVYDLTPLLEEKLEALGQAS